MTNFILTIENDHIFSTDFSGGKGSNLAHLTKVGINVPSFFILGSSLYKHIIKLNDIEKLIGRVSIKKSQSIISEIQSAIITAKIPESIAIQITCAFKDLIQNSHFQTVAVRSSALEEDLQNYSFAGQLDSYLNIKDEKQLLESIKKCWASLWNERVLAYTSKHKRKLSFKSMAVVVQQMIPVEISGICFTNDPRDLIRESLIIEAHKGIGAEIVGGKTIPTNYHIRRRDLEVDKTIYPKDQKEQQELLTETKLKELARLCLEIETYFATPQDIEWGLYKNKFYFLQSRPITTLERKRPIKQDEIWCNYFFAERFPQPVSPLGWTILKPLIEKNAFREPLHFLGFHDLAQSEITRCFSGRPFTNLKVFRALHYCFPTSFVSADKRNVFYDYPISTKESVKRIIRRLFPFINALLKSANWIPPIHLKNWNRFLNHYIHQIHQLNSLDYKSLSDQSLWQLNYKAEHLTDRLLNLHRWSITFAELIYHFLDFILQKWLPQINAATTLVDLHRGIPGNKTVEMNIELRKLSELMTQKLSKFKEKGIHHNSNELSHIPMWELFFEKYGHRSISLDIYIPTWSEDNNFIIKLIEQYKTSSNQFVPTVLQRQYQKRRKEASETIFQTLAKQPGGFTKRKIFEILLHWSQHFFRLRENQRYYWHQALAVHRKIFVELGVRFSQNGWLKKPEMIFFLTKFEIQKILQSQKANIEFTKKAKQRFEQFERWKNVHPPALIDQSISEQFHLKRKVKKLNGIGVSPGIVSGKARVLTSLRESSKIRQGEILVVPTTDPSWTPLFGLIHGLVMEVGGVLSHGSIIAREFGTPAVTSVERVTSIIETGMRITVDGNEGMVWILDD